MRILGAAGVVAGVAMSWLAVEFGSPRFCSCYLALVAAVVFPALWLRAANFGPAPVPAARWASAVRGARSG